MTTFRRDGPTVGPRGAEGGPHGEGQARVLAGRQGRRWRAHGVAPRVRSRRLSFGVTPPDATKYEAALQKLSDRVLETLPAPAPTGDVCKGVCNLLVQTCRARVSTTEMAAMAAAAATSKGGTTLDVGKL
eukprot:6889451-Prymnesium_polylepis.1